MEREGVIKFDLRFTQAPPLPFVRLRVLDAWRSILNRLGLIGHDPQRYGGVGYGNVSERIEGGNGPAFVITGSQTAGLPILDARHYALVTSFDVARNAVIAEGETPPSSESLTHAMVYRARPDVHFVFHVHSPVIWRQAAALGLPTTDPRAEYGTPAMAREVERLLAAEELIRSCVFAMGGHEDGVVSFGTSADEAGLPLLALFARALAQTPDFSR